MSGFMLTPEGSWIVAGGSSQRDHRAIKPLHSTRPRRGRAFVESYRAHGSLNSNQSPCWPSGSAVKIPQKSPAKPRSRIPNPGVKGVTVR